MPAEVSQSVRRRKPDAVKPANGSSSPRPASPVPPALNNSPPLLFIFLSIFLSGVFFFLAFTGPPALPPNSVRAIVIDAGSTGTRAQLFTFSAASDNALTLVSTKLHNSPRRLAALGFTPGGGPEFFKPLIDKLRLEVPAVRARAATPIVLRATAGLRLLGGEAAGVALKEARDALRASGFLFKEEWISVLGEVDEAAFGWTAVNYLARTAEHGSLPVGILDLGGSSLEVAFTSQGVVEEAVRLSDGEVRAGVPLRVAPSVVERNGERVVAQSFLGMGLGDIGGKVATLFDREGILDTGNPCFRKGGRFPGKTMRVGLPGEEEVKVVSIAGGGDFDRCVASIEIVLRSFDVPSAGVIKLAREGGISFYAFAYFFDKVVGFGLGENAAKAELLKKGEDLCNKPMVTGAVGLMDGEKEDEACSEFSFVYAVLKRLSNDFDEETGVTFRFIQYIDGHMLGWALGSVLETLDNKVINSQLKRAPTPTGANGK